MDFISITRNHPIHPSPLPPYTPTSNLWNWRTKDFPIIFHSWHIHSGVAFFWSLVLVFLFSMAFEYFQFLNFKIESIRANAWKRNEEGRAMLESGGTLGPDPHSHAYSHVTPMPAGPSRTQEPSTYQTSSSFSRPYEQLPTPYLSMRTPYSWVSTLIYAINRFFFIFLLLIYFTFNGFLIFSSILGSSVGYLLFRKNALAYFSSKNYE